MKKINLFIIAILASATAFMTSCGPDDQITPAPTVTITEGDQIVMPNTDVEIAYSVTAAGEIDEISFLKDGSTYGDPITKDFETDTTHAGVVIISTDEVTDNFTFAVSVTDKEGKTQQATVNITIDDVIVKSSTIKLYTAPADQTGTEARFASLTDFTGYSWASAQGNEANIDLMYYNSPWEKGTSAPHFISPDTKTIEYPLHNDEVLTGANATYFAVLEGDDAALFTDWDNIDDDTAINSITTTLDNKNVTWTTGAGTIIAFQLVDGKKGVIKVGAAVDGNGNTEYWDAAYDYIEFDVIVQKYAPTVTK